MIVAKLLHIYNNIKVVLLTRKLNSLQKCNKFDIALVNSFMHYMYLLIIIDSIALRLDKPEMERLMGSSLKVKIFFQDLSRISEFFIGQQTPCAGF
jgi:hypothetical protein